VPISNPSTSLYQLGRGILYLGEWTGTTPPTSYRDVGNCPKFEVEVTEEDLNHFSYRSGYRNKDKIVVLEVGYSAKFTLDEISVSNLTAFLKGTLAGSNVIHALTAASKEFGVKFVTDNPEGENQTWWLWRAKLSPDGAMGLIGDEWVQLQYKAEGLSDAANHASSPYFDVTVVTTTTVAVTTTTSA
jgi:hypothetical protein